MSSTRHLGRAKGKLAHSTKDPAPEANMSRDTINIPDNVLLDGIKEYSEKDQDDLIWLMSWAGRELGSREQLCKMLVTDWSTVVRICQGKYSASIRNFMSKVREIRDHVTKGGAKTFVDTLVTRKIFDTLDYALSGDIDGGKIVLISGHTRRGKSKAVREWGRQNNHGRSVYIDCPESGGLRALMHDMGKACRVNTQRRTSDLRDRLIRSFNRRRILILDEVTRLLPSRGGRYAPTVLEFIRRLHDVTHCAIALVATPVFAREMEAGYLRDYLEQLLGRIAEPLYIPDKVYKSECRDFIASFRKNPPAELVSLTHRIANEPGRLGVLFELLHQANALAKKKREQLAGKHLAAAYQRRKKRFVWPEED